MLKKSVTTAVFATAMAAAGQASADIIINPGTYGGCLGLAACNVQGAALTALDQPATFVEQNANTAQGLGINKLQIAGQAGRANEIQGDQGSVEGVRIVLPGPMQISDITLAHFYSTGQIPSDPNEIADLILSGAIAVSAQVSGGSPGNPANITLTGFAAASAVNTNPTGGVWQILNPFGGALVTSIEFRARDTPVASGDNSDYSIAQVVATPEPTTLGLLGIGLLQALASQRAFGGKAFWFCLTSRRTTRRDWALRRAALKAARLAMPDPREFGAQTSSFGA